MINSENVLRWLNAFITDETKKGELDIIDYLKRLVKADNKIKQNADYKYYFDYLWKIYPRKVAKAQAYKTFEKKVKGKTEEQVKQFCNSLWKKIKSRLLYWEEKETEKEFIPHLSTFINQEFL